MKKITTLAIAGSMICVLAPFASAASNDPTESAIEKCKVLSGRAELQCIYNNQQLRRQDLRPDRRIQRQESNTTEVRKRVLLKERTQQERLLELERKRKELGASVPASGQSALLQRTSRQKRVLLLRKINQEQKTAESQNRLSIEEGRKVLLKPQPHPTRRTLINILKSNNTQRVLKMHRIMRRAYDSTK